MKKNTRKVIIFATILALFLFGQINEGNAYNKSKLVISHASNITVKIKQNDNYTLPKVVKVVMSDKSQKNVSVVWNKASINTKKTGTYVCFGTIKGYKNRIKLTVIVELRIVSAESQSIYVLQGDNCQLPTTVAVNMSDGSKKYVTVRWDGVVDTSSPGTKNFTGSVNGYHNKIKFTVVVEPIIVSVENENIYILHLDKYQLPTTVAANMSDGSKKYVPVKWDGVADTSTPGTKNFTGTIEGYDGSVSLILNIYTKIISIEDMNVTINTNAEFSLPLKLQAKFSDNSVSEVDVKWNSNNVSTDKSGIYVYEGKVDGYKDLVKLTLHINEIYSNVEDVKVKIFINDSYKLPKTVPSTIMNGVTTEAAVVWNVNEINTSKAGVIKVEGVVIGYGKKVNATISILAEIVAVITDKVTIPVSDQLKLPDTIKAKMSNDEIQDLAVKWTLPRILPRIPGSCLLQGVIIDYNRNVTVTLSIEGEYVGNLNSNLLCGGIVAQDNEWIYFNDQGVEKALYKIKRDGTEKTKISNDNAWGINVVGQWIYYFNYYDNQKIYKIGLNGENRTRLSENRADYLVVIDDWIYYTSQTDPNKVFKMKVDGSQSSVFSEGISNICYYNKWFYYFNQLDHGKLYKIKDDGSQKTKLSDDIAGWLCVNNGYVYYSNLSDGKKLYRIRIDGSNQSKLCDDPAVDKGVFGNLVYYRNDSDGKLYTVNLDGTGKVKLCEDNAKILNLADDWVYYMNLTENKLYRIKMDGTNREAVK